uniref:DUF7630 domain-containing protein n=1 Tax=Tetradesmus obliquus TaxID=3088 RepID=A0A383VXM2_TETOB|eukprot:jgi/Sobl393_1/18258/SZX69572.1
MGNKAYEGGAIAMVGFNSSITNCTFSGNRAIQNGFDVLSSRGGMLNITGSNITLASPTVTWERVIAGQCLKGEYFGELEGTCRRCPGSTYSLATPVPAVCSSCPPIAKCPGGDNIEAGKGFFRVSNASEKVVSCPRAGACLEANTCADSHEGLVCGSCSKGLAFCGQRWPYSGMGEKPI